MNLVRCPACSNECSPAADACPRCGHPFDRNVETSPLEETSQISSANWWKIGTIAIGVSLFIILAYVLLSKSESFKGLISAYSAKVFGGLNDNQKKAADEALIEFRKLDAATDVGVNKSEYSKMLVSALAASTHASELLPDGELKNGIDATMTAYLDAQTAWNIMKDDGFYWACSVQPDQRGMSEPTRMFSDLSCNPEGGELARKYQIPFREFGTGKLVSDKGTIVKKEAVGIIWKAAKEQLKKATSSYNK